LTAISEFDDYVTLDSIENNKDGSIDISNIYKGVGNFSDMYYEMSAVVDYLNEKNYLNDEQKSQINEAMNKLNKHLEGRKLKLAQAVGKENPESFNNALKDFNSLITASEKLFEANSSLNKNNDKVKSVNVNSNVKKSTNLNKINKKFSSINKNKKKNNALLKKISKPKKRLI